MLAINKHSFSNFPREHVRLKRGEAEDVALTAEQAKRLWAIKSSATLAEQIGRESTSMLDREELIFQLLGACGWRLGESTSLS